MRDKQRRPLSPATTPGPIDKHGHPGLADKLERALEVSDAEESIRQLTHGFHAYPARMHPLTARRTLKALGVTPGQRVLDPFCGSGTVLVEAVRAGASALGIDASPLALLVARAKVWPAKAARRRELVSRAKRIADAAVEAGKAARRSGYEAPAPRAAAQDRDAKVRGWFDPHVRRELETLLGLVEAEPDPELRGVLTAVLSSILQKMSRRASDTRRDKTVRKIARGFAARVFADRAAELVDGLNALYEAAPAGTPPAEVRPGDARDLGAAGVAAGLTDLVVTSPPYAGTYDYAEQHALRLAFLGLPQAPFEKAEIGARRGFARDVAGALRAWDQDLGRALGEIARALAPKERAALLIGDSLAGRAPRSQAVYADDTLVRLAPRAGLAVVAAASAHRPPFGAAERDAFAARPKREHLVVLERT